MKVDQIAEDLRDYFHGKSVLEVACGEASLSCAVSQYATFVCGIDVSLTRIKRDIREICGIWILKMDAVGMGFTSESFDVVVTYNALGHLVNELDDCASEMVRVLKRNGYLIVITTWKMDKAPIPRMKDALTSMPVHLCREIRNRNYWASIWKS